MGDSRNLQLVPIIPDIVGPSGYEVVGYPSVIFQTNSYEGTDTVVSSTIFVGDTIEAEAERADINDDPSLRYIWIADNSCEVLPQERGVEVRYEMYDAAQNILQSNRIVDIDTCR